MSLTRDINLKRLFLSLLVVAIISTSWSFGKPNAAALAASSTVTIPTFEIPAVTDAQQASEKPNIIVIGTGGTLAGKASNGDPTNFQSYAAGTYLIADLVAQLPNKEKIADVSTYQFGNKGSGGYSIQDLYDLSLAVEQSLEQYDGAVVTTGTDTMEEIAYFLDLTVQSEKPVVVTGAMRPWDVIGTDGPANLYQAIKTAASNKTKWYGTVIMLNDTIQAAREVTKSNTHRMDTFDTAMFGVLGYVDDNAVRMYRLNGRASKAGTDQWKTPFNLKTIAKGDLPSVGILYNYQAAGAGALNGLVEEGVQGIVTAGTGAGGISSALSSARSKAIKDKNIVFVSSSRTGSGSVYSSGNGIIAGDNLDPQHARIMLILTLAFTDDFNQMKTWFATVGTQEISINVANDEVTPEPTPIPTPIPTPTPGTGSGSGSDGNTSPEPTVTPIPEPTVTPNPDGNGQVNSFTDTKGHWAEENISKAVTAGIVTGYTDGSYKPNVEVTRAEFLVMLMRLLGEKESNTTMTFTDEASIASWARTAVLNGIEREIVTGYADGSFQPNRNINRMELVLMAVRAMDIDLSKYTTTTFADNGDIATWAKAAVAAAAEEGIIQGKGNNKFDPNGTATRAEAITIIMNMMKFME
ncbi:MAG: asparaginase domain-containing protein [Candidatus Pristimantibacillus lignocellulolyticus]|uniref:Asparaginase domain-containing protein n=1 Tax=Candidatus Pristimantibacillus lignocellulolyticus TaxID=2994561 RepID=A0A9J6ZH89_9BACL|nr:MAG: asparaginase domain-containing protein [Candidatus Pristimantibacillus lignocellulolyticus]